MHNKKIAFGDNFKMRFSACPGLVFWQARVVIPSLIGSGKYSLSGLGKCFTCAPQEHTFLHHKKGLTLLEIITATIILSLVMTGMVNVFLASKRHILHSRSRMTGGELGKYFLDPLQMQVKQSDWDTSSNDYISTNPLHKRNKEAGSPVTLDKQYTPYYTVDVPPGFSSASSMRKVTIDITWPPSE